MPEKFKTWSARLKRLSENKRINIEIGDKRGQEIMAQSVFEQTGEQIAEAGRKAFQAASAVADALEAGVGTARRVANKGGDVARELLDDTRERLKRHPIETVAATFAAGIATGIVIGWMTRRRQF
jgi:ElaB/YqjD/DUF883 family membrane-anchored ribosome-binding protein